MKNKKAITEKLFSWVAMFFTSISLVACGVTLALALEVSRSALNVGAPEKNKVMFSGVGGVCDKTFFFEKDNSNLYVIPGQIGDKKIKLLFDTGASRTAISVGLASELGLLNKPREQYDFEIVETANGKVMAAIMPKQEISIGGHLLELDVIALPIGDSEDAILGMDVIEQFNVKMTKAGLAFSKPCDASGYL